MNIFYCTKARLFPLLIVFCFTLGCSSDDDRSAGGTIEEVNFSIEKLSPTLKTLNTSNITSNARGVQVLKDTLLVVFSRGTNAVESYILSMDGEIDSATHFTSFSASNYIGTTSQGANGHGIFIRPDHLSKMWIYNRTEIWQFDLTVPGDISSAVHSGYYNFSDEVERGHGIFFNTNGTSLYVDDRNKEQIHQFDLNTPWDISGFQNHEFLTISDQHDAIRATVFQPNGKKMFTLDTGLQQIHAYELENDWTISNATLAKRKTIDISNPRGFSWNDDGSKAYIMNTDTGVIHQFEVAD